MNMPAIPVIGTKVKRIVRLPVSIRSITIGPTRAFSACTLMEIDDIGVYVYHKHGTSPSQEDLRRSLIGVELSHIDIEADTIAQAAVKFMREYPGATTGARAQALVINESREEAHIFPECRHMHRTTEDEIVCGEVVRDEEGERGEYGGCVLNRYSSPGFYCPIEEFWNKKHRRRA
ncbi:MAG TPA: hypothetical protein VJJ72_01930 [Candidatus Paceibacterota bacterium]